MSIQHVGKNTFFSSQPSKRTQSEISNQINTVEDAIPITNAVLAYSGAAAGLLLPLPAILFPVFLKDGGMSDPAIFMLSWLIASVAIPALAGVARGYEQYKLNALEDELEKNYPDVAKAGEDEYLRYS